MHLAVCGIAWLMARLSGDQGQDLIEYSLFGGLIALALMVAMAFSVPQLSEAIGSMLTGIGNCVDWNASSCGPF